MKKFILFSILLVSLSSSIIAQEEFETKVDTGRIEVFLIDAYVKQEPPYIFILSFYTSEVCLSNVIIDNKYEYLVSNGLSEAHSAKIDITSLNFLERNVNFVIETIDSLGNKYKSEEFEFDLPYEPIIKDGSSIWTLCLFAGSVFLLPMPGYVNANGNIYYSAHGTFGVSSVILGRFIYSGLGFPTSNQYMTSSGGLVPWLYYNQDFVGGTVTVAASMK